VRFSDEDLAHSALLILVHGSPKPEANEPVYIAASRLEERAIFQTINVGFLECNAPSIPEAIDGCAQSRVRRIIAVPYFLHTGDHVSSDLPDALDEGRRKYPAIEFAMGEFLGNHPLIAEVLAKRAASA
jgi:sirohydrochlorin ferrochelatase